MQQSADLHVFSLDGFDHRREVKGGHYLLIGVTDIG